LLRFWCHVARITHAAAELLKFQLDAYMATASRDWELEADLQSRMMNAEA